jgi:hypothetical protein
MHNRKKKMGPVGEWITYFFMLAICTILPVYMYGELGGWDVNAEIEKVVGDQERMRTWEEGKQMRGSSILVDAETPFFQFIFYSCFMII